MVPVTNESIRNSCDLSLNDFLEQESLCNTWHITSDFSGYCITGNHLKLFRWNDESHFGMSDTSLMNYVDDIEDTIFPDYPYIFHRVYENSEDNSLWMQNLATSFFKEIGKIFEDKNGVPEDEEIIPGEGENVVLCDLLGELKFSKGDNDERRQKLSLREENRKRLALIKHQKIFFG